MPPPSGAQVLVVLAVLSTACCWQRTHHHNPVAYYHDGGVYPYSNNNPYSSNNPYPTLYPNDAYQQPVQPVARGSATFLPGPPPPLYLSPAPPPALPAGPALRPAPYSQASRYAASPLPVDRVYNTRGRPAAIPTPYAKYSDNFKVKNAAAWTHPNALTPSAPEPGFYGSKRLHEGGDDAPGAHYKQAAVGFYGKPL